MNAPVSDDVTIVVTPPILLYLSTVGDVSVGGLGAADDADIYAWFGGTTYTRVFDASANGVPAAADVDALVVEDSDTLYVSFLATTTLPGVGRSRRRTSPSSTPGPGACTSTAPTWA